MSLVPVTFTISEALAFRFPALRVHGLRCRGVAAALRDVDTAVMLVEAAEAAAGGIAAVSSVTDLPVVAGWRAAYAEMGVKPSKFRSSIEALLRRVGRGDSVLLPVGAVNLYNACSIRWTAPIGAYDVAKLGGGPVELRYAIPGVDRFLPLGAGPEAFPLTAALVVYASGDEVLCWGFNCRDSARAALDPSSDDVVFFGESVTDEQADRSAAALDCIRTQLAGLGGQCGPVVSAAASGPASFVL